MFDLHFHSIASDWKNSGEEIINDAYEKKLQFIALTDHDVISSNDFIDDAQKIGI